MTLLEEAERNSCLWNIEQACAAAIEFACERIPNENNAVRAIERQVIAASAALRYLRKTEPELAIRMNVGPTIDFAERVLHEYREVKAHEVWAIVQRDLPRLLAEVRALLPPT